MSRYSDQDGSERSPTAKQQRREEMGSSFSSNINANKRKSPSEGVAISSKENPSSKKTKHQKSTSVRLSSSGTGFLSSDPLLSLQENDGRPRGVVIDLVEKKYQNHIAAFFVDLELFTKADRFAGAGSSAGHAPTAQFARMHCPTGEMTLWRI